MGLSELDNGISRPSTKNTSLTPLASAATFTGTADQSHLPDVMVSCFSDTSGTLFFDFKDSGASNWRTIPSGGLAISANAHERHIVPKGPCEFRVRFVNSASNQSTFELFTYFGNFASATIGFDSFSSPRVHRPLSTDASGRLIAEDALRMQVDHGNMYHCSFLDPALADNDTLDMVMTNPADDYVHMIIEAAAGGFCDLLFYEGTAFTGGDTHPVYNVKRTSAREWGGTMVVNPTVSDVGTALVQQVMPGGSKNQASGGDSSFGLKWICNASESYMVRVTNRSGGTIRASIGCNHYSAGLIDDA